MHTVQEPQDTNLLSISQAAQFLGISEDTLRRWDKLGKLVPNRTLGNSRRYELSILQQIKESKDGFETQNNYFQIRKELQNIRDILQNNKKNVTKLNLSNPSDTALIKIQAKNIEGLPQTIVMDKKDTNQVTKHNIIKLNSIKDNIIHKLTLRTGIDLIAIALSFGIVILLLILIYTAVTKGLHKIEKNLSNAQQFNQDILLEQDSSQPLLGSGLIIGEDKVLIDERGNIQLSGAVSGGYIDSDSRNFITNSGFEQNASGKALYYIYAEDASEANTFVTQDSSLDGQNALKVILEPNNMIKIQPTYADLFPGKTYTFSLYVKGLGTTDADLTVGYGTTMRSYTIAGDSSWQLISVSKHFEPEESPTLDSFSILIQSRDGVGTLYVDNIQLEGGSTVTAYKPSHLTTDGIIHFSADALFPAVADTVSIGTIVKPFQEIVVNEQIINNSLEVYGDATIDGNLVVSGDIEFPTVIAKDKIIIQTDGLYTGSGIGTKRLDSNGNLQNITSLGLVYGTLTSTTDYLTSSVGLSVGGNASYYFNKNGYIKAAQLNSLSDIKIGDPNGETDSLGIYFSGVSGHSNEAGMRFNTSSGKLEYRDDNNTSWTTFDSLSESSSTTDYSASNGLTMDGTDILLGGSFTQDTTTVLGAYDLIYNLNSTGDIEIQDNGSALLYISDTGNIGIGTNSPAAKLDVASYANFGSSVNIASTLTTVALKISGGAHDGYVLTSDANGNTVWEAVSSGATYTAGNGLTLASSTFTLGGTLTESTAINQDSFGFTLENPGTADTIINLGSEGDLLIQDNGTTFATFADNGSFTLENITFDNTQLTAAGDLGLGLYDNASNGIFVKDGGNVGIGTTTPGSQLTVNGVGSFTLGTVALPGITFGTDTNTGMWSSDPDTVNLSTNGLERLRVDSNGNVGIGTTSPTENLHVIGNAIFPQGSIGVGAHWTAKDPSGRSLLYIRDDTDQPKLVVEQDNINNSAAIFYGQGTSNDVSIAEFWGNNGSTYGLYVQNSGNVGIGDNSPAALFSVGFGDLFTINNLGNLNGISGNFSGSLTIGENFSATSGSYTLDNITFDDAQITAAGDLGLGIYDNSGNGLTIGDGGNIGIGTTSPFQKMHLVNGSMLIDSPNPSLVGNFITGGSAFGVYVSGKYAYVADYTEGLKIMDISNPNSPVLVSSYDTNALTTEVVVAGKYAYLADGLTGGVKIVDVSNPKSPTLIGTYNPVDSGGIKNIYLTGKYIYATDWFLGLLIIDVSNPASPILVGSYASMDAHGVYVSGKYAYVANGLDGLQVIDVSNPTSPSLAGTYDTSGDALGVYVSGKYAYVANGLDGLQVIDVSNPTSPSLAGTYDTSGDALGVYVSGKYAYIADGSYGLQVIDVSNPATPSLAGMYRTIHNAMKIYVSGKYAYVGNALSGLQVIDVGGADIHALNAGNVETNSITITDNGDIGNNLYIRNGINVGTGGLFTDGLISSAGSGINYFAGNVGIGVLAPAEKMEVAGNIRVTGGSFIDDGTTLAVPDYVFESDYNLMNLTDLGSYIELNKHLPGVPDMNDTKGWAALSLQDRDMKLLEKIEENIIYTLELNSKLADTRLELSNSNHATMYPSNQEFLSSSGDLFIQSQIYDGILGEATPDTLANLTSTVTDSLGNAKVAVAGFGSVFSAKLTVGIADIKNLITDTVVVRQVKVEDKLLSPVVEASQILTDQLYTQNLTAVDASISGTLSARQAVFGDPAMKQSSNETIAVQILGDASVSGTLKTKDASVSGELFANSARIRTLIAERIKADSIEGLEARIENIVNSSMSAQMMELYTLNTPYPSPVAVTNNLPSLPSDWEQSLNNLMTRLDNVESATSSATWQANSNLAYDSQIIAGTVDTDLATVNTFLAVLGNASMVNAEVTNSLSVQTDLNLTRNSIATLSDTLYIQPTGLGKIDILAGAISVESNGNLYVNGDLYLKGSLYAYRLFSDTLETKTATVSGTLFTNLIKPKDTTIAIDLSSVNQNLKASESALLSSKFQVLNSGSEVASIDASGSARFKAVTASKLYLPYTYDTLDNPIDSSISADELNNTADSIGIGTIKAGQTSIFMQAPIVTKESLMFVTPTTTTNIPLAVTAKEVGKGFIVSITKPQTTNINFNWWIIN